MTYWTITCGGIEKSLADWGVLDVSRKLTNNGTDTLSFGAVADFDAADVFAFGAAVVLRKGRTLAAGVYSGGTQWFVGEVRQTPRRLSANSESHGYVVAGPLAWLTELVYGQTWYQALGPLRTSHVILNRGITTDAQVRAVLEFAISAGMPAQVGTLEAMTAVPISEGRDMTCWEVISAQLRWSPDAVLWVDYTTTPPSINLTRYSNLAEVTATVGEQALVAADIQPRNELVLPGVLLNFETSVEVDGEARMVLSQQRADGHTPPVMTGFERRCLVATFDLQGPKITHETASIVSAAIQADGATDADRLAWWKARLAELSSTRVTDLAIPLADVKFYNSRWEAGPANWTTGDYCRRMDDDTPTYFRALNDLTAYDGDPANDPDNWEVDTVHAYTDTFYVLYLIDWDTYTRKRELVDGVWAPWLEEQGYSAEKITVIGRATYLATDPSSGGYLDGKQEVRVNLVATDATTGEYTSVASYEEGETEPAGLANFIYATHAILHYSGSVTLTEEECAGGVRPGNRLNLDGGTGRFATMRAVVQSTDESIDTGTTSVNFGPPEWLGPGDILEWLRAWRTRRIWTAPSQQDDGRLGKETKTSAGRLAPSTGGGIGAVTHDKMKLVSGAVTVELDPSSGIVKISGAGVNSVTLDVALCNGKALIPREVAYCDAGVVKKMMVIGSAVYT
jgi:hypothetical protein